LPPLAKIHDRDDRTPYTVTVRVEKTDRTAKRKCKKAWSAFFLLPRPCRSMHRNSDKIKGKTGRDRTKNAVIPTGIFGGL